MQKELTKKELKLLKKWKNAREQGKNAFFIREFIKTYFIFTSIFLLLLHFTDVLSIGFNIKTAIYLFSGFIFAGVSHVTTSIKIWNYNEKLFQDYNHLIFSNFVV